MELFMLAVRAAIIVVLLVSGIAKLFDREGSTEAMVGFGVPLRLVPMATAALPWIELGVAIGLLFAPTITVSAIIATLLFLAFTLGVLRVMASGEQVECHCFGQLSMAPVSWWTVARNVLLTIAAALVAWWSVSRDATSLHDDLTLQRALAGLVALVIVALTLVISRLWQEQQALLTQIGELQGLIASQPIPKPSPDQAFVRIAAGVSLTALEGTTHPAASLHRRGAPTLLVLVTDSCRACRALLPEITAWQKEFDGLMRVAVIGGGDADAMRPILNDASITDARLHDSAELTDRLNVTQFPTAVLIDHDGFVRAKPALGGVAIRRVIEELRRQAAG